jgi:hypothetical protein
MTANFRLRDRGTPGINSRSPPTVWARYNFDGSQAGKPFTRLSRMMRYPRQGTASRVLKLHPHSPTDLLIFQLRFPLIGARGSFEADMPVSMPMTNTTRNAGESPVIIGSETDDRAI